MEGATSSAPRRPAERGLRSPPPAGGGGARHRAAGRNRGRLRHHGRGLSQDVGARAARQHPADRRDAGRADHHPRPDFGRAFQPGGVAGVRAQARLTARDAALYVVAQVGGGVAGAIVAHLMFALPLHRRSPRRRAPAARNGSPNGSRPSASSPRSSPASGSNDAPCPGWSGSTSPPPTGSPPRRRSPIPRWRSRARSPTPSPASALSTCRDSSSPQLLGAVCALALMSWLLREESDASDPLRAEAAYDDHDLSQPGLRHVAQHARNDPAKRRGAGHHRISEDSAEAARSWSN